MKLSTIALCAALAASAAHQAHADGRSVMLVKGMAYGIAQECPAMHVDAQAVRNTKRLSGNATGDFYDFMDGMIYTSQLLRSKEKTCDDICGVRPGTCYFVEGQ